MSVVHHANSATGSGKLLGTILESKLGFCRHFKRRVSPEEDNEEWQLALIPIWWYLGFCIHLHRSIFLPVTVKRSQHCVEGARKLQFLKKAPDAF